MNIFIIDLTQTSDFPLSPKRHSGVSDQDVLQQYSPSGQKRSRGEEDPGPTESHRISTCPQPSATAAATHPRPRNRFATLLQRRNQEGGGDGQEMQSRYGLIIHTFSHCYSYLII